MVYGALRYSYRELAKRVGRGREGLLAAGLRPGDRVAVLAPNCPAVLEAHYAVPAAGGVLVTVNTRLSASEVAYILDHSGARVLLVHHSLANLVDAVRSDLKVVLVADAGDPADEYEQFLADAPATGNAEIWDVGNEDDPISINYTSGTTGEPKGVVYSHRGAYLNALGQVVEMGLGPESAFLWTLPMFHCNGWCFTWAVTAVGGTHVCPRKVDPAEIWDLFEREGITHYNGAPTVHTSVVTSPDARRLDRRITVAVAGAPPTPTLLARLDELNFRAVHVYGLTETYGPHTVRERQPQWAVQSPTEQAALLCAQGHEYVTADPVRVVTGEMDDVPADGETMGEVLMRGNNVALGYYDDPVTTAAAFRDGWFHSGDLAVRHPDGGIEVRDRKKDIIISGGENISTIEVERMLCTHPAVLECAVVAAPHDHWGERPVAFVALHAGADVEATALIEHCRSRMAHFKCPSGIVFGELPKTSTGKVQKNVLRERATAACRD